MIIDMTTPNNAVMSLGEFLNIYPEDILEYVAINKDSTVDDFIEHFNINVEELLGKELYLSCLHVTTNNDECKSIKQYGLTNLRDSIRLDTPFCRYLREKGIDVDVENKKVSYKGKVFDVSSDKREIGNDKLYLIHFKLFKDYQINAFFSYDNVLNYGGGVRRRPEFLYNLSQIFSDNKIENDWYKQNNKCYVIKYKAELQYFTHYTFDDAYSKEGKIRWIIKSCIRVIHDNIFYSSIMPEIYAYMNFDVNISYSNIIKIYTEEEYITEFNINDN